jgi:ketosteroid isomerase-like protein
MLLLLILPFSVHAQISEQQKESSPDTEVGREIKRISQELLDAVAGGNKAVWERYLADDCIYTDENGRTLNKAQLIEDLRPLPSGYSGTITIAESQVRIYGDAAVIANRLIENEVIYGQKIIAEYRATETYVRRDGRWQMLASHVIVIPSERKSIALKLQSLDDFTGQYEMAPGVTYSIARKGDKLIGQRAGRSEEELLAMAENIFFRKGTVRGEKVFVKDKSGRVTQMIDRRDNNDLVWKKIK